MDKQASPLPGYKELRKRCPPPLRTINSNEITVQMCLIFENVINAGGVRDPPAIWKRVPTQIWGLV